MTVLFVISREEDANLHQLMGERDHLQEEGKKMQDEAARLRVCKGRGVMGERWRPRSLSVVVLFIFLLLGVVGINSETINEQSCSLEFLSRVASYE